MAQSKRIARVNELIRMELANVLINDVKDPRIGFVTVTGVDVSPDLRDAKVKVSVMGNNKERRGAIHALNHSRGFIQFKINEVVRLKFIPRLYFILDKSLEDSMKIGEILKKIHDQDGDGYNTDEVEYN